MKTRVLLFTLGVALAASLMTSTVTRAADDGKTYKVFLFVGQSNAQGKIDKKTLDRQAKNPDTKDLYKHLREDGKWAVRDDVFATYQNGRTGPLTLGFGSSGRTGPELEFGWVLGDHIDEPVVILKTCQGGISLHQHFRPPSAGLPDAKALQKTIDVLQKRRKARNQPVPTADEIKALYGEYYRLIFSDLRSLSNKWDRKFPATGKFDGKHYHLEERHWDQDYPALKDRKPELAGIVWIQGWNDMYGFEGGYEGLMKLFIKDLRKDLGAPKLPFVIPAMGQNGSKPAKSPMQTVCNAQLAMEDVPEFKGNVKAFPTDVLVDVDAERLFKERKDKPDEFAKYGTDAAYHYYGSPIWYGRIGHKAAEVMLKLMKN